MDRQIKGILGEKLGMTQVFDASNRIVPVTVVKAGPCVVTQVRTPEKDGYSAVQLAFGGVDPRRVTKPLTGHFSKAGVTPRRHIVELRTTDAGEYQTGQQVTADVFEAGQRIDVVGTSKGKGTAGVMKRHGFKGLGGSHGTQRKHRSPGSIGGCATPAFFAGVFAAVRMSTSAPFGPGMAPLTRMRFCSRSTAWMVRPCAVYRTPPIRPAIRTPLKTRPGVAQPPIEPGRRCTACAPWEAPWPLKP